ncbi:hypothetical protein PILCRDRAFT_820438 [Piloderma croceum F 1598]|uniref:Peptidase A1 domain-containing protein n=1 Tax=Piloderma croceum (strain F 1598) TaxID=765440 RepID=A0A0C3FCZ6_PILCF|nr:hypothetical protein PILCRDRAFT_820438 [Piloderma croceum F 1598]
MFLSSYIQSLLFFAVFSAYASPITVDVHPVKLGFKCKINTLGSSATLPELDRMRAMSLVQAVTQDKRSGGKSITVTNSVVTYTAEVGVGSPPTQYKLLIDTGSSNTWIGAKSKYKPTKSSHKTGDTVSVSYGSGSFSGDEYTDTVTFSSSLKISKQSIGVATESSGFNNVDGILGLGPVDLTVGTLSDQSKSIPTVTDSLFADKAITSDTLGIFFQPTGSKASSGELTFGGVDTSKTSGTVEYVPVTKTSPASRYWGIDQSISYGSKAILTGSGLVDTGTTLVLLSTTSFNVYKSATGGVLDSATGLLKITSKQYSALKPLNFKVGSNTYTLNANAQIWPRSLNTQIGGAANSIYLIAADLGQTSSEFEFISGYAFLERFYSVYDTKNKRVGFARTAHTNAETN